MASVTEDVARAATETASLCNIVADDNDDGSGACVQQKCEYESTLRVKISKNLHDSFVRYAVPSHIADIIGVPTTTTLTNPITTTDTTTATTATTAAAVAATSSIDCADNGMKDACDENDKLEQQRREMCKNFEFARNTIFLFDNQTRLTERRYETKNIKSRQFAATFYDGMFYPLTRTKAVERRLPRCKRNQVGQIVKCIHRYVLYPTAKFIEATIEKTMTNDSRGGGGEGGGGGINSSSSSSSRDNQQQQSPPSVQRHQTTRQLSNRIEHDVKMMYSGGSDPNAYSWLDDYTDDRTHLRRHAKTLRFRLSFDAELSADETAYYLSCEVEYDEQARISDIYLFETFMLRVFYAFIGHVEVRNAVKFTAISNTELFESVKPKVQVYSKFNQRAAFVWAPKWNGVSAKFIKLGDRVEIWPDLSPRQTIYLSPDDTRRLALLDNYALQIELLHKLIVIVHIITIKVNDKLHYIDLYNNLSFLRYLYARVNGQMLGKYRLVVQKFRRSRLQQNFDMRNGLYDGLIIYQNNQYIKWKQPTIDAAYMGNNRFFVGSKKTAVATTTGARRQSDSLSVASSSSAAAAAAAAAVVAQPQRQYEILTSSNEHCHNLRVGKIYELSSTLEVLRERIDRAFCATWDEYVNFVKNADLLARMTDSV